MTQFYHGTPNKVNSNGHILVARQMALGPNINSTSKKKRLNMKSKFKRWIRNWLRDDKMELESVTDSESVVVESHELDSNSPLRITVHKAAGGMVIETRTYDRVKDRNFQSLHIVTHDQDLGQSLGKIITMENLKV